MSALFEEKQKFTQWWLWVILLSFPIISAGPFDDKGINYNYVLIGIAIPLVFYEGISTFKKCSKESS